MVKKIRELCKKKGISISKLEKETGLGNGIIGKWEKFGREPKFAHIKAIADYFGVPVSYLTGEAQKESPPQSEEPLHTIQDWEKALDGLDQEQLKQVMDLVMKKFMEGGK